MLNCKFIKSGSKLFLVEWEGVIIQVTDVTDPAAPVVIKEPFMVTDQLNAVEIADVNAEEGSDSQIALKVIKVEEYTKMVWSRYKAYTRFKKTAVITVDDILTA